MNRTYAGIGPRKIQRSVEGRIITMSGYLRTKGFTCHSGGAVGADSAFQLGAGDDLVVWLPEHCTPESMRIAASFHPAWNRCSQYAKALLGRNPLILLGADLKTPVDFVMTWSNKPNAGGTGMALSIARHYKIPICNLAYRSPDQVYDFLRHFLNQKRSEPQCRIHKKPFDFYSSITRAYLCVECIKYGFYREDIKDEYNCRMKKKQR